MSAALSLTEEQLEALLERAAEAGALKAAAHLALGTWGRVWSLHEIQAMLAHSDQRVTERYVRRAVDALAEAAKATPGGPALPMRAGAGIAQSPASGQRVGNAVRLAREVLLLASEASPHTVSRAIELAGAVLEEARAFDAPERVG